MIKKLNFFKEFIKNPRTIGSLTPSSIYLANNIIGTVDFSKNINIVEYGPGSGIFTDIVKSKLNKKSKLILVKINKLFSDNLTKKYKYNPNIIVINDDVNNIELILKKLKIESIDYVISGIPFSSLPKKLSINIIKNTKKVLQENSYFIAFQYSKINKKLFDKYFNNISYQKVWKNFPPAVILNCEI